MPYKDPSKKRARAKKRWQAIKADPEKHAARREEVREAQRERMKDPEKRAVQLARTRAWNAKNRRRKRELAFASKYGITLADYEEMHAAQGGVCAICKRAEQIIDARTRGVRRLAVDHDHESGEVRGLLCYACNTGIGMLQDSTSVLRAAIAYLERRS